MRRIWIAILGLAVHGAAQTSPGTLTTILDFYNTTVFSPETGLLIGPNGVLFGTASFPPGYAVYSLTPPTELGGSWTYATLYQTQGTQRSQVLTSAPGLAIDRNGVLYGATNRIVDTACTSQICGWIFSLTPPASPGGAWSETTLYTFTGGADGTGPQAGVTIGQGGVLYGTALGGAGKGLVYSLTPPASPGGAWTQATLHSFADGADGAEPSGPLAIGDGGILYGTTSYGGGENHGAIFSLTPPSSPGGKWTEAVIYGFTGGDDSEAPSGGVLIGPGTAGQPILYGAAGADVVGASRNGIVYSLTPPTEAGGAWALTVLYAFPKDYDFSPGPLVWGESGVLYGSTLYGGAQRSGSIYALIPPASPGAPWTFRSIYSFAYGFDAPGGNSPYLGEALAVGGDGLIYGTTSGGGPFNFGIAFSLRP